VALFAQVLGGRHDGMIVRYCGPVLVLPVLPSRVFVAECDALPPVSEVTREYYRLQRGDDGELFYVAE
jgi:hypothetical protein